MIQDGGQQAVKVFIDTIIMFYEALISLAQVNAYSWWVIPFQRSVPEMILVVLVVRETCEFLTRISE